MTDRRPRVLVTRPEPGAARTAKALQAAGLEPIILPFTEIIPKPVPGSVARDAGTCDVVAVTSANALVHTPPNLIAALAGKPVFAVGDATAKAARDQGLTNVQSANGAADQLAVLISAATSPGARIAYLCGQVRMGELENELASAGYDPLLIATYDVQKVSCLTDEFAEMLAADHPDAIIFHSGVSAAIFDADLLALICPQHIERISFFSISRRVAELLPASVAARIVVVQAPRDDALVEAVKKCLLGNPSQGAT